MLLFSTTKKKGYIYRGIYTMNRRINSKRPPVGEGEGAPEAIRGRFHGNAKFTSWVFVLNGSALERLPLHFDQETMVGLAYQREVGPRGGVEHVQGYIQMKSAKRASAVAAQLGCPLHARGEAADCQISFRPAKGSMKENVAYCTGRAYCRTCHGCVDGHPEAPVCTCGEAVEKGRVEGSTVFQGRIQEADDWGAVELVAAAQSGKSLETLYLEHPHAMFRFGRQFMAASTVLQPRRRSKPFVVWVHGASGTGKSKLVHEIVDEDLIYMSWSSQWFDGYEPAKHLLFCLDELRGQDVAPQWVLRFFDRYAFKLAVKGSSVEMRSPVVVVTSSQDPVGFWREACEKSGRVEDEVQLMRRIDLTLKLPCGENDRTAVISRCRAKMTAGEVPRPNVWRPEQGPVVYPLFQQGGATGSGLDRQESESTLSMEPVVPVYEVADRQHSSPEFVSLIDRWVEDGV